MPLPCEARHLHRPGHSAPVTPADMAGRVAQFADLAPDPGDFPDLEDTAHARSEWYLLPAQGLVGEPSPIRAPRGFHPAVMRMPQRLRPSTHAHPYNKVFMPLVARCRYCYGNDEAHSVEVGRWGVISVPVGVMRTFASLDVHDAHVLVVFDTPGDAHTQMLISPRDYESFYKDGWVPGVEATD